MHELRFRGELLGFHADETSARAHLDKHYKDHAEAGLEGDFTIAPRRAHSLFCRGSLVDTFDEYDAANAHAAKLVERDREARAEGVRNVALTPLSLEDFAVTSGTPPPVPLTPPAAAAS